MSVIRPLLVCLIVIAGTESAHCNDVSQPMTADDSAASRAVLLDHYEIASAALSANAVHGLMCLVKELGKRDVQSLEFDQTLRTGFFHGLPPRIRPFFSDGDRLPVDIRSITLTRSGAVSRAYRLTLVFAQDRIAKHGESRQRLGEAHMKGHTATIFLSRRKTLTAVIDGAGIGDPRAKPEDGMPGYEVIQHNRKVFSKRVEVNTLEGHPWTVTGQQHPVGLADIEGLSLQVEVAGWWKNVTDVQPVTHLFAYADSPEFPIWLAYKEMSGHVDASRRFMQVTNAMFAAGIDASTAFPDYLGLKPLKDDHFSVINLSEEGKASATIAAQP